MSLPFNLNLKPTLWHLVLFSWLVLWTFYLWTFSSCEHFHFMNVFVCGRFHLVNTLVLLTFLYCERFRVVNVFALWTFSHCEHFRNMNAFVLVSIFVLRAFSFVGPELTWEHRYQNEGQVSTSFLFAPDSTEVRDENP